MKLLNKCFDGEVKHKSLVQSIHLKTAFENSKKILLNGKNNLLLAAKK